MWHRIGSIALLIAVVAGPLLTSCSMPRSLKTLLFENVPPPGEERPPEPVVVRPRHPPLKPVTRKPAVVAAPKRPPPPDWRALYAKLPRTEQGQVDWVRAIAETLISPKPGLAPDAEALEPTDLDLEFVPEGMPEFKVVFSHKIHTQWLVCANCHSGLFEMEKGKAKLSMEKLNNGAYCGLCHRKVATPDLNDCKRCHGAMPG